MMKRSQIKRSGIGTAKQNDLKKPFGFCCDAAHQDFETRYNMRIPPFETSLTKIAPNKSGPDLKFRIQDTGRPAFPVLRSGSHKVKSMGSPGRCKRCRGPMRWYIEDEVALAKEIIATEKKMNYLREKKREAKRKREKLTAKKTKKMGQESEEKLKKNKKPA